MLLSVGIWRFWPTADNGLPSNIPVELAPELQVWMDSAITTGFAPSQYQVSLKLKDTFVHTIESVRTVQLGYALMGPTGVLFQGVAPCQFKTGKTLSDLFLPNPNRVSARAIHVHLAR